MSLERLKNYFIKIALYSKILRIAIIVIIVLQTLLFAVQSMIPGTLMEINDKIKLYGIFVSDANDSGLCLFELSQRLCATLLFFLIIRTVERLFTILSDKLSLEDAVYEMKLLSCIFAIGSIVLPIERAICHQIFVGEPIYVGGLDLTPLIISGVIYFIALTIQSKAVIKEEKEQ